MNKIIMIGLALLSTQGAFAQNLGVLSDNKKPEKLLPATEFAQFVAQPHHEPLDLPSVQPGSARTESNSLMGRSDLWGLYGYGYGYYPYSYYGSYYPYYSYPYYGYSSYYPYYGYGTYGWWLDGESTGRHVNLKNNRANLSGSSVNPNLEAARAPVVCFAQDSSGNTFAEASEARNVLKTQQAANEECLASGASCIQNLGCALAHE
ncbi:MAG: hypothetical protein ACO3A2_04235 [Bdellovibrionia bacterium]